MSRHAVKRPEPLLTRAHVVTAISILAALLVHVGAGSVSALLDEHADQIAGLVLAAGPILTAVLARAHVTPAADPRDVDGAELVPAGSAPATLDAARALDEANRIHPAE